MRKEVVSPSSVLQGYEAVSRLYPHTPSLSLWRAWEYAAYANHRLPEPVLDLGCGDGQFFRLLWPQIVDVAGVDDDPAVVDRARQSGIYREVRLSRAQTLPFAPGAFASVFANCSLEHMADLPAVLHGIHSCLRAGGVFLLSVVTDRFLEEPGLPRLLEAAGATEQARRSQAEWEQYHHLTNALTPEAWAEQLTTAGFEVVEHSAIVHQPAATLFLLMDQLWHAREGAEELGARISSYLSELAGFPEGFQQVLAGLLQMEHKGEGIGAVFLARKVGESI